MKGAVSEELISPTGNVRAVTEWSYSERLLFLGRLRHGPVSHLLASEIIENTENVLLGATDMLALDLVQSSAEALEAAEKRRSARASDLVRMVLGVGHPLAGGALDEASRIVHVAEALAADVMAVRQAAEDMQEAILLGETEIPVPPAPRNALALAPQHDTDTGAETAENTHLTSTLSQHAGGDANGGITDASDAVVENERPSVESYYTTFGRETSVQQGGEGADVGHGTAEPEVLVAVVRRPEDHPGQNEHVLEGAILDATSATVDVDGRSSDARFFEEGGAGLPVKAEPVPGLPECYVHALPRYRSAMSQSGPGSSSGRGVVQAVDVLLTGCHTPLISANVDLAERRAFAAVVSAWHALRREFNVTVNVARVMQRLGAVVKSRLAPKRGVDFGDAEAVRIFEATVVPTVGIFGGGFIPLDGNRKQPMEIVVVWTHPQRVAQALWRLPASDILRVVLVMATLNEAQWHDVSAALDGRGPSAVFDTGFVWWIGSKASEVLGGDWKTAPDAGIGPSAVPAHGSEGLGVPPVGESATVVDGMNDAMPTSGLTASEEVVVAPLAAAAKAVIDEVNDVVYTEIMPRRHLWNKPWCWSPLAEEDEKAILSGPKHVWALLGTRAGGLDLVNEFLSLAKPGMEIHPIADVGNPKEFRMRLQEFASLRSGQHLALVRANQPLDRAHWSAVCGVVGNARRYGAKSLRVVVLVDPWVDPTSARLAVDGVLGRELGIASLAPLDDEELAEWTRVASSDGSLTAESLRSLANDMGGWVGALSDAVDSIRGHMAGGSDALELLPQDVGLSKEMKSALERLPTIRGSNPLDPPALLSDTTPPWLLRCGSVRLGDDGSRRIDPALWRVMKNEEVMA